MVKSNEFTMIKCRFDRKKSLRLIYVNDDRASGKLGTILTELTEEDRAYFLSQGQILDDDKILAYFGIKKVAPKPMKDDFEA